MNAETLAEVIYNTDADVTTWAEADAEAQRLLSAAERGEIEPWWSE